jgi:hypothetical protein
MTTPEIINTGELPNDGSGDPLRLAFEKINNNFANLFAITSTECQMIPVDETSLRLAFEQINDNFTNLFEITNGDGETLPTEQVLETQQVNESFSGNINIGLLANNVYYTLPESSTQVEVVQFDAFAYVANLAMPTGPYGAQEYINIGAQPNDGEGDPLRTAFAKINNNFSNLFFTATSTGNTFTAGLTADQVIYQTPAETFSQGKFQIRSSDPNTIDMQDITITASITNNLAGVKFSGYGTLFDGNSLCRYDMDVFEGNVRLLVNPIKDAVILHFIASEVTFIGDYAAGLNIGLDGYPDGSVMGTEGNIILTTESV